MSPLLIFKNYLFLGDKRPEGPASRIIASNGLRRAHSSWPLEGQYVKVAYSMIFYLAQWFKTKQKYKYVFTEFVDQPHVMSQSGVLRL